MFSHINVLAACALLSLACAPAGASMYSDCNAPGAGPIKIAGCKAVIATPGLAPEGSYIPAYRRLCKAYARGHLWDEGLRACNSYFAAYPGKVRAADYIARGVILEALDKKEEAVAHYSKSIAMRQEIWQAYFDRGTAYYKMGKFDAALADLSLALELNALSASARFNRGLTYKSMGKPVLARGDFAAALALGMPRAQNALDKLRRALQADTPLAQRH